MLPCAHRLRGCASLSKGRHQEGLAAPPPHQHDGHQGKAGRRREVRGPHAHPTPGGFRPPPPKTVESASQQTLRISAFRLGAPANPGILAYPRRGPHDAQWKKTIVGARNWMKPSVE